MIEQEKDTEYFHTKIWPIFLHVNLWPTRQHGEGRMRKSKGDEGPLHVCIVHLHPKLTFHIIKKGQTNQNRTQNRQPETNWYTGRDD